MQLHKAVTLFLGEKRPTTAQSYRPVLKSMCDYIGHARPVEDVKIPHLLEYAQHLRSRDYAPATYHKHVKTMHTFWNWCVRIELCEKSPAAAVTLPRLPRNKTRDKALSDDEYDLLMDYFQFAKRTNPRDYALVLTLADTGARPGGLCILRWSDVDFTQNVMRVVEKGDRPRMVAFGHECAWALQTWRAKQGAFADFVFTTNKRKPMTTNYLSHVISRHARRAGIERPISAYKFRHRFGHRMADEGVSPTITAAAMGNSPDIVMAHYYHYDEETALQMQRQLAEPIRSRKSSKPQIVRQNITKRSS